MMFFVLLLLSPIVLQQITCGTIPVHPQFESSSSSSSSAPSIAHGTKHEIHVEPIHLPPLVNQIQPQQSLLQHEQHEKVPEKDLQIQPIEPQINPSKIRHEYHLPIATVPAILPTYQYGITYPVGINYPYNLIAAI